MNRAERCSVNHNGETGSTEDESRTDFLEKAEYRFHKGNGDVVFECSRMNRSLKSDKLFLVVEDGDEQEEH